MLASTETAEMVSDTLGSHGVSTLVLDPVFEPPYTLAFAYCVTPVIV
jgi:hypothetical protein